MSVLPREELESAGILFNISSQVAYRPNQHTLRRFKFKSPSLEIL